MDKQNRVGQQIGKYRLRHLIGNGAYAEVYEAVHIELGIIRAVKILRTNLNEDEMINKFRIEASMIANLIHPNIVRVLDCDVQNKFPYFVMDYAPHGSLKDYYKNDNSLPLPIIASYVKQIASALQYAHDQEVIHRDIKPANMLLAPDYTVWLGDFGIAVTFQARDPFQDAALGTMPYMSPEQFDGEPTPSSDQYSLAVVVYEWLCGERPFQGEKAELKDQHRHSQPPSLCQKNHNISTDVEQVVLKALAKSPKQRFPRIKDFADTLEQAIHTAPVRQTINNQGNNLSQKSADPTLIKPSEQTLLSNDGSGRTSQPSSESNLSANSQPAPTPTDTAPTPTDTASQPQPSIKTYSTQKKIVATLSILTLLVLIISIIFIATSIVLPKEEQNQTTLHFPVHNDAISTASSQMAATATTLDNEYNSVTQHAPTFYDPLFSEDLVKWVPGPEGNGGCEFTGNAFHVVALQQEQFQTCFAQVPNYRNFVCQVQMTIVSGSYGGIIFRANSSPNTTFYLIGISSDGSYSLLSYQNQVDDKFLINGISLQHYKNSVIKSGLNVPNLISIMKLNDIIYIFINKHYISQLNNVNFDNVGTFSANQEQQIADVSFNNIEIWKL